MAPKEQWYEKRVGGDYRALALEYSLSPVTARILANRGIRGADAVRNYLDDSLSDTDSYEALPDIKKAVSIIRDAILGKKKIRVIGDYDIDGVCSSYILSSGIRRAGGNVDVRIPHRINDGYGINDRLVKEAKDDGTDLVITCDNGISASDQVELAHQLGMQMIITDHHEIPFHMEGEDTVYDIPDAEAVVDIKVPQSRYEFRDICGAVVAYKVVLALFDRMGIDRKEAGGLVELAAFATIGDVMPLEGENRKLVKAGLKRLAKTENPGMKALIREQSLEGKDITVYHVGFVLGPCINATGRLGSAEKALHLLEERNEEKAEQLAHELCIINLERKDMTEKAVQKALEAAVLPEYDNNRVLVIYLPDVHESVAGIVAGKVREQTGKPSFVLTKSAGLVKGSGRSIDEYDMYSGMTAVSRLFVKFGGHKMAGGLSMEEKDIPEFRKEINRLCTLTDEDITKKIRFDMVLPFGYADLELCRQIESLEPFGTGNPKPLFAAKGVALSDMKIFGKSRNCLRAKASDSEGTKKDIVFLGEAEGFYDYCKAHEKIDILYSLQVNRYRNEENVEIVIRHYR